ncbi:hypothetical protein [Sagittula stellata]|uniref:Helix-turn-helix domain-containing protein n=1 Tax=Sagittula stellata (strain ATCC 700073 / DSM 11524 / E-37) TaxID=388399 RepID=A3K1Z3_SAGS3|nr:hypothetical protein [Sagittula stellata]EBA08939.1 hypothetical protein SSE37_04815 [Sagittula stellata E-37]
MAGLTTTELAKELGVTKGRVSQYVSEGKLEGCYQGDGRARRFDLVKAAEALGRRLDKGQMMGNGAATRRSLRGIEAGEAPPEALPEAPPEAPARKPGGDVLPARDPDRYELARTQKVEEEARRLRRQNVLDEGTMVLAEEAARQAKRQLAQEIAQVETMLRDAARRVADVMGVDYREVRSILIDQWRAHRGERSEALTGVAAAAGASDEEREADF